MRCAQPLPGCENAAEHLVVITERPAIGVDEDTKAPIYGMTRETARGYCSAHVEDQVARLDPLPVEVEVFLLVDETAVAK